MISYIVKTPILFFLYLQLTRCKFLRKLLAPKDLMTKNPIYLKKVKTNFGLGLRLDYTIGSFPVLRIKCFKYVGYVIPAGDSDIRLTEPASQIVIRMLHLERGVNHE